MTPSTDQSAVKTHIGSKKTRSSRQSRAQAVYTRAPHEDSQGAQPIYTRAPQEAGLGVQPIYTTAPREILVRN